MTVGWVLLAVGLGGVVVARLRGGEGRTLGTLQRLPVVPIAEARDGNRVRVTGRVRLAERPLQAPLSGRACAGWVVRVEERTGSAWSTILVSQRVRSFFVEDGSGRALVEGERLRLAKAQDLELHSGLRREALPEVRRWLGDRGVDVTGLSGLSRRLRCREGVLADGALLTVAGAARWEPDLDPGAPGDYRSMPMRLLLSAGAGEAVLASDLPEALAGGEPHLAGLGPG